MKNFKTFIEAVVKFEDHDADDSDFKALLKKLGLQASTKKENGNDVVSVTGNNAKIGKMLKTMKMKKDSEGYAVVESLNLEAVDKDMVIELKLYIENDGDLYKQKIIPIVKNIQKKMKSGKYDHKKAPKLWMYLVTEGAKKYAKEFPGVKFNKQEKEAVAQEFADEYKDEIEAQDGEMF